MADDRDVKYHFQCQQCDRIFYVSHAEMVKRGWEVAVGKGYVCPACVGMTLYPTISMEKAQQNRQEKNWSSLVNP